MAQFSINGVQTGGRLYALNTQTADETQKAVKAAQNDGLDQLFFEMEGQNYVLEGDGLALNDSMLLNAQFEKGGVSTPIRIIAKDNEVNTAAEGLGSLAKTSVALFTGGAAVAGVYSYQSLKTVGQESTKIGQAAQKLGQALTQAGHLEKLPISLTQTTHPLAPGQVMLKTSHKTSHALVLQKELQTVEKGVQTAQKTLGKGSVTQMSKGLSKSRIGLIALGVGVSLAGAFAIGGAVSGAARSENTQALDAYRGKEIK